MVTLVPVPAWFKTSWYVLLALVGIQMVLMIAMAWFTPAMTFLKAKIRKTPLIYVVGRAQNGAFMAGKMRQNGVIDVKNVGPFTLSERSHTIEKKSGIPLFFAFNGFTGTMPPEWAAVVNELREKGYELTVWDDYAAIVNAALGVWPDEGEDPEAKSRKEKIRAFALKNMPDIKEGDKRTDEEIIKWLGDYDLLITPYTTFPLHELQNMFPYTLSPELIETQTQFKLLEQRRRMERLGKEQAMVILVLFFAFVLAAVIAYKFLKTGDATCTCQFPGGVWEAASTTVQNMTG